MCRHDSLEFLVYLFIDALSEDDEVQFIFSGPHYPALALSFNADFLALGDIA